jgi:inhibitor of cysteine peptidase
MKSSVPDPSVKAELKNARSPIGKPPPSQTAPREVPPGTTVSIKDIRHGGTAPALNDIHRDLPQSVPERLGPPLSSTKVSSRSGSTGQRPSIRDRQAKAEGISVASVVITESDEGRWIKIPAGQTFEVSLPENPTTGYRWSIELFDTSLLQFSGDSFSSQGGAIGGGGMRTFSFVATRPGTTDLRLRLARQWEPTKSPGKKASFKLRIV